MVITINLNPAIPSLPKIADKKLIDVRYMLIAPFASAHIYWDNKINELVYEVEEPILQDYEKEALNQLENALFELINVNVAVEKTIEATTEYIDKTARLLIDELNIKITAESYNKIFYYLFRDFIGFNEVDPLLRDYFIEDIECNGVDAPIYVIHRIYRNLRTNIAFKDIEKLASFVEKLAQRCGRYISYAQPLLDGTLPDGTRINATFTKDVTTRGPTFTARKFTSVPWTPIQLISMRTLSPEMLAYFWILIEHKSNILISGSTAAGKCVTRNTPVYLGNGKVMKIGDIVENKLVKEKIRKEDDWEFANGDGTEILSMDENLKIKKTKIERFWRHKAPAKLYHIVTKSGRKITSTPEHPFFVLKNGALTKIRADKLNKSERIAVPRNLPFFAENNKKEVIMVEKLKDENRIYVYNAADKVRKLLNLVINKYSLKNEKEIIGMLNCKPRTFYSWKNENSIPLKFYAKLTELAGKTLTDELKLKGDTNGSIIKIPKICPELFRFLALVISDGHLRKNYAEFHNSNEDLLNEFKELGQKLFGIKSEIKDYIYRVKRVRLYSPVIAKLLNLIFEIPYGNKARNVIVPKILFEQNNECIKEFISGVFDCEGYAGKRSLEIGMSSKEFLDGLSTLFLRFGIVPRTGERRITISEITNIKKFNDCFILRHSSKKYRVNEIAEREAVHTNVDLIPNCANLFEEARLELGLSKTEFARKLNVSAGLIGMWERGNRLPSINMFNKFASYVKDLPNPGRNITKIANSDIFWDEIGDIMIIENKEEYVYDLTVENSNFLAGNIPMIIHNTTLLNALAFFIPPEARVVSIEETREVNLPRENWLPAVARTSIGIGKIGEVDLFSLLKSSFRQTPDYLIVGEVRGKEAYVLFQGMASLPGNEKILVLNSNQRKMIPIEKINAEKCRAICINPYDEKSEIHPISALLKHPSIDELLKIKTKTGREVVITGDHSLFGYDNGIYPIEARDLKNGDKIIIPSRIPVGYNDVLFINLLDCLDDIRVYAPDYIKRAVEVLGYEEASKIADIKSISDYYANFKRSLPSSIKGDKFKLLMEKAKIEYNIEKVQVKFLKKSKSYNAKFEITNEFLRFLGYYISEGSINKSGRNNKIALYSKDESILNDMIRCIRALGCEPKKRITKGFGTAMELAFSHKILFEFLLQHCGKGAINKKIPNFIFGLSKERIGEFLTALYSGDGSIRREVFNYYTVSKHLANDLAYLLLGFGIVATIKNRGKSKIGKYDNYVIKFYRVEDKIEFLKYVGWLKKDLKKEISEIKGKININKKNDIYLDEVTNIEKIKLLKPVPVFDISVSGRENFIGGFGGVMLHNSGHASLSTIHADSVDTLIRRLQTPPIELPPTLVNSLDCVVITTHATVKRQETRRVREIVEIINVNKDGTALINTPFVWDPGQDIFYFKKQSKVFEKISAKKGIPIENLYKEFETRVKLLYELYKQKVFSFDEVGRLINDYYKTPVIVLSKYNIQG